MREPENKNYKAIFQSFINLLPKYKKATAREITEGLRPIREGIENLPQAITFPSMQPLGEASGEEEPQSIGEIAGKYLNRPITDEVHRIYKKRRSLLYR